MINLSLLMSVSGRIMRYCCRRRRRRLRIPEAYPTHGPTHAGIIYIYNSSQLLLFSFQRSTMAHTVSAYFPHPPSPLTSTSRLAGMSVSRKQLCSKMITAAKAMAVSSQQQHVLQHPLVTSILLERVGHNQPHPWILAVASSPSGSIGSGALHGMLSSVKVV